MTIATTLPSPSSPPEACIDISLPPAAAYTPSWPGRNGGTGVGLIEIYNLGNGTPMPTPTATVCNPKLPCPSPTPSPSPTPTPELCVQNFDGVTAPALPPGWVASNLITGDGTMWVTSTTSPDTSPNDAFIADQDGISDKAMVTRAFLVVNASASIAFRNNFDTEFSSGVYWDGFVLEVSSPNISGGDYLDITDSRVGGSFVSGGYTGEIDATHGNPLAGRMAWGGYSGGYIDTVVNLGTNLAGQTVTFRFRMGTDEAVSAPGVRIDGISFVSVNGCP